MPLIEADTRAKLVDPAIHKHGWTEDLIRREETAGTMEIISGKPRWCSRGKIAYVLRVKVNVDTQPVALALIEAKEDHKRSYRTLQHQRHNCPSGWISVEA